MATVVADLQTSNQQKDHQLSEQAAELETTRQSVQHSEEECRALRQQAKELEGALAGQTAQIEKLTAECDGTWLVAWKGCFTGGHHHSAVISSSQQGLITVLERTATQVHNCSSFVKEYFLLVTESPDWR